MRWFFEPGHTAAEFRVRHMMVTNVRGHFKNVRGSLDFDPDQPAKARFEATIDAASLWSGEPDRDTHLKSSDFLDVEHFPTITYKSHGVLLLGPIDVTVAGDITIRGSRGDVDVQTSSGDITLPHVGAVNLTSLSGDVGVRLTSGAVTPTTNNGDITIATTHGNIDAPSISGDGGITDDAPSVQSP